MFKKQEFFYAGSSEKFKLEYIFFSVEQNLNKLHTLLVYHLFI